MAKTLDFNTVQRPTLLLTMLYDDKTQIRVSTPNEALVSELAKVAPELESLVETNGKEAIEAIYDLAAHLISCNRDHLTVTAEDLRNKYRLDLESMIVFFDVYVDFINEITNAKN